MFGLFRPKEVVARWRFYGKPDMPGSLIYSREGGAPEGLDCAWIFALTVSKTLYTVGRVEVASAACLQLMAYSQMLRETERPGWDPFDLSFFDTLPNDLDAEQRNVESLPLHRSYSYEFTRGKGQNLPLLQTAWPREYSPADVLSIFRVIGKETLSMAQVSMGPHIARGVFALLMEQIAVFYGDDQRLHTQPSSILAVPQGAMQHVMNALDQVMKSSL